MPYSLLSATKIKHIQTLYLSKIVLTVKPERQDKIK